MLSLLSTLLKPHGSHERFVGKIPIQRSLQKASGWPRPTATVAVVAKGAALTAAGACRDVSAPWETPR